jgi:hypothetical protein
LVTSGRRVSTADESARRLAARAAPATKINTRQITTFQRDALNTLLAHVKKGFKNFIMVKSEPCLSRLQNIFKKCVAADVNRRK